MSGIFDKYLNMINGSKHTHGQMNTMTNTGSQFYQVNSKEKYIPYVRRHSSVTSEVEGEGSAGSRSNSVGSITGMDGSNNPFQNPGIVTEQEIKKILHEPNNRVNF